MGRARQTQFIPGPAAGVAGVTMPRREKSIRIVAIIATIITGAASGSARMAVFLEDGASNGMMAIYSEPLGTFSSPFVIGFYSGLGVGNVNAVALDSTFRQVVSLPPDLWIDPQQTLFFNMTDFQADDQLVSVNVVYEAAASDLRLNVPGAE